MLLALKLAQYTDGQPSLRLGFIRSEQSRELVFPSDYLQEIWGVYAVGLNFHRPSQSPEKHFLKVPFPVPSAVSSYSSPNLNN